jgi:hypothetical protein
MDAYESTIHFSRPLFCSDHGRNLFLPAVLQVRGTRRPAISCPQKCALDSGSGVLFATFETAHRLRAEGASVYGLLHHDELEMPGQVRALSYVKECRAGAFMAHP